MKAKTTSKFYKMFGSFVYSLRINYILFKQENIF